MQDLRAAVFGGGVMGRQHARVLSALPGVRLMGVVDPHLPAARIDWTGGSAPVVADSDELGDIDLAVVATPTSEHLGVSVGLSQRGIHHLVEKPLASSSAEASRMLQAAQAAGVVLAVGHIERFNPAVALLKELSSRPLQMSFTRLSPYPARITDGVVSDLMVHDLDLACWLAGEGPEEVHAVGSTLRGGSTDLASALLRFSNGVTASLQVSRVTPDKVRRIEVTDAERFIVVDTMRQDLLIKRHAEVDFVDDVHRLYRQASVTEIPFFDRTGEPLARELADFVEAVRSSGVPLVTGEQGAAAVALVERIEHAIASRVA